MHTTVLVLRGKNTPSLYSLYIFFSRLDQNSLVLLRTLTFAKQFLLTARLWQLADNYDTRTVGKYENLRGQVVIKCFLKEKVLLLFRPKSGGPMCLPPRVRFRRLYDILKGEREMPRNELLKWLLSQWGQSSDKVWHKGVEGLKPKAIIAGTSKTKRSKNFIFIFSLIILMQTSVCML